MSKDLSAVGASASAPKEASGADHGKELFDHHRGVEIRKADNGGYIVRTHHKREPRRGEHYTPYVEPKEHAFTKKAHAFKHASDMFDDDGD